MTTLSLIFYALASFAAGVINAIAGGGSFLTYPALLITGLDPRAANVNSTIALYPMQITTGYSGRAHAGGTEYVRFRHLFAISIVGGVLGAILLLLTPPTFFGKLVPWLILFATTMFAVGTFFKKPEGEAHTPHFGKTGTLISQFFIAIYGGYFGGGIGILMLAALSVAGMPMRKAGATKNILAAAMNGAAVIIFVFCNDIAWQQVGIGILTSVAGGQIGVRMLHKINERKLRIAVVAWGLCLAVGLYIRSRYS